MGSWTCHWTALLLSMLICTLGMENTCDVRTGWRRKTYEWRFSSGGPPQIRVSFLAVFHYHQTSSRHLTTAPTEWIQSVVKDAAWVGRGSALSYDPQANHSPWSFSHGDRQACTKLALEASLAKNSDSSPWLVLKSEKEPRNAESLNPPWVILISRENWKPPPHLRSLTSGMAEMPHAYHWCSYNRAWEAASWHWVGVCGHSYPRAVAPWRWASTPLTGPPLHWPCPDQEQWPVPGPEVSPF